MAEGRRFCDLIQLPQEFRFVPQGEPTQDRDAWTEFQICGFCRPLGKEIHIYMILPSAP
jgi:hypothetical protein